MPTTFKCLSESDFGKNIRYLRQHKEMTQKQLAKAAGIAVNSLISYEKGLRYPPATAAWNIARALNVSLDAMITRNLIPQLPAQALIHENKED